MITARVGIGGSQPSIVAHQIELETPHGVFRVGVDNNGDSYIMSDYAVVLRPAAANRVLIRTEPL